MRKESRQHEQHHTQTPQQPQLQATEELKIREKLPKNELSPSTNQEDPMGGRKSQVLGIRTKTPMRTTAQTTTSKPKQEEEQQEPPDQEQTSPQDPKPAQELQGAQLPQISITPPTGGKPADPKRNKLQRQTRRSRQQTEEPGRSWGKPKTGDAPRKNLMVHIGKCQPEEPESNANHPMPDGEEDQNYVNIQTAEGREVARLQIDNSNRRPIRKKLNLTRDSIPEPPRMMRNAPKYYTAAKLLPRQVRKFDIRNPGPYQKIWRR